MKLFRYQALDASGKILNGTMQASSGNEIAEHLKRIDATLITVSEQSGSVDRTWREWLAIDPANEEITAFTFDLAMLLAGGVTLDEALIILRQMESRRWLAKLIHELHFSLSGGMSFSKALEQHPRLFSPVYVKMIEVAEVSGRLEQALNRIAEERHRSERLRKRLISALAYPTFLAVSAFGVLAFVLLYIIPQFEGAIEGFRDRISPSAMFVFQLSRALRDNLDYVLSCIAGLLIVFLALKRFGEKRALWIKILSVLPLTGKIVAYHTITTFCRTLGILLENGVDISTSLRLIRDLMQPRIASRKMDAVIADVRAGRRVSQALASNTLMPGHVVQMLRVGEESGDLGASADRIAHFYTSKLDGAIGRLLAIAGPVLMICVSMLIGWLILSVMSALMSINDLLV